MICTASATILNKLKSKQLRGQAEFFCLNPLMFFKTNSLCLIIPRLSTVTRNTNVKMVPSFRNGSFFSVGMIMIVVFCSTGNICVRNKFCITGCVNELGNSRCVTRVSSSTHRLFLWEYYQVFCFTDEYINVNFKKYQYYHDLIQSWDYVTKILMVTLCNHYLISVKNVCI